MTGNQGKRSRKGRTVRNAPKAAGMIWSRETVATLDEETLRVQVLVPLFEAMGYQGVYHYHGGAAEHGKDLVMFKLDPAIGRSDYAVVAKAVDIKGGVSKPVTQETLFQVNQAFRMPYRDPKSGEERSISHCFVMTSRRFPKESREALRGALSVEIRPHVTILDGGDLWSLIEEYLGDKLVLSHLRTTAELLDTADPDWGIQVSFQGRDFVFQLVPKSPDARPLAVSLTPRFPETPEGRRAKEEYERHEENGSPVTLDSSMVESFSVPDFVRVLMPSQMASITVGRRFLLPKPLGVDIELIAADGLSRIVIPGIQFSIGQSGSREVSLNNDPQNTPFKITLRSQDGGSVFSVRYAIAGHNVYRLWEVIQVQTLLSAIGTTIKARNVETGNLIFGAVTDEQAEAPGDLYVEAIRKLLAIQRATGVLFDAPQGELSEDDLVDIDTAYTALTTGRLAVDSVSGVAVAGAAKDLLNIFTGEAGDLRFTQSAYPLRVMGKEIEMGPVEVSCKRAILHPEDRPKLEAAGDAKVAFRVIPVAGMAIEARYLNWPRDNEKDPLR